MTLPTKTIDAPAGNTAVCAFWLLLRRFERCLRDQFPDFVRTSPTFAICSFLSIQYCATGRDMDEAINDFHLSGSIGLRDRVALGAQADMLRQAKPPEWEKREDKTGDRYYGIIFSKAGFNIWCMEALPARDAVLRHPSRSTSTDPPRKLRDKPPGNPSSSKPSTSPEPSEPPPPDDNEGEYYGTLFLEDAKLSKGWNGCRVFHLAEDTCLDKDSVDDLVEWINGINYRGLKVFATELREDLELCLEHRLKTE